MKKTLVKLGVLAAALALALVVVSCEQPTDEGSANSSDTILRLWFEDTSGTGTPLLAVGDEIIITLASFSSDRWKNLTQGSFAELDTTTGPGASYTSAAALNGVMETGSADGAVALLANRSLRKTDTITNYAFVGGTFPGDATTPANTSTLQNVIGNTVTITGQMLTYTKEGTYIDLFLYDTTAGRNQVWQKSGSYYVFLGFTSNGGSLDSGTYVYTGAKTTTRNQAEKEFPINGLVTSKRFNDNVKKVSFKSGVNELHLQNFAK